MSAVLGGEIVQSGRIDGRTTDLDFGQRPESEQRGKYVLGEQLCAVGVFLVQL